MTSTDERNLAEIGRALNWSERDYENLVADVCTLTLTDAYQMLFHTIAGALNYAPVLDTNAIRRLLPIAIRRMEDG